MALATFLEWVLEHRRLAVLLTRLVGPAGLRTRELLQNPDLTRRVERNLPLIRERVWLPDRFNELLGHRAWVVFEDMDARVCEEAILLAERGDIDGAEVVLARHFDADTISRGIERLAKSLDPFRAREKLLMEAVEDHREGRYHASVPVALAQLDGLARDLTGGNFFLDSNRADHLLARDSVVGHPSGLKALSAVMSRRRRRTSGAELNVPYRHGILHGRDLGYANELVSAKCFAALLALGSWADSNSRGEQPIGLYPPIFDPDDVGIGDVAWAARAAAKTLLRSWFPHTSG